MKSLRFLRTAHRIEWSAPLLLLAGILVLLPPLVPLRGEVPSTAGLKAAGNRNAAPAKTSSNPGIPISDQTIPYFLKAKAALYPESPRTAALAWFDDARLGMFIHWGVWGKHHAAWAMFNRQIPLADYQKLAREVDASGFNAAQIVKLAEDSGMRYITFVAKHHDGFCLWDSKATDWDSMDYPMHRDFVGELAKALKGSTHSMGIFSRSDSHLFSCPWPAPASMPTCPVPRMWLCKLRFAAFELPSQTRTAIALIESVVSRLNRAASSNFTGSPRRRVTKSVSRQPCRPIPRRWSALLWLGIRQ